MYDFQSAVTSTSILPHTVSNLTHKPNPTECFTLVQQICITGHICTTTTRLY